MSVYDRIRELQHRPITNSGCIYLAGNDAVMAVMCRRAFDCPEVEILADTEYSNSRPSTKSSRSSFWALMWLANAICVVLNVSTADSSRPIYLYYSQCYWWRASEVHDSVALSKSLSLNPSSSSSPLSPLFHLPLFCQRICLLSLIPLHSLLSPTVSTWSPTNRCCNGRDVAVIAYASNKYRPKQTVLR